ncbi:MAG: cold shock domain-containing protein [Chloroflexi bacterium]|nr:cold shock domain-containing protein [Chloroflexota bacterium]MBU1747254.1 cold shock domain-containing protein [Chloroflexota bacterium]MBU1879014.1 cold shock domain-containing protein [Chloroflexota bacterium]
MSERETGMVKWFSDKKGVGFITRDVGGDVLVPGSAILAGGFKTLEEGQRVGFIVEQGDPYGLQAKDVVVLPE